MLSCPPRSRQSGGSTVRVSTRAAPALVVVLLLASSAREERALVGPLPSAAVNRADARRGASHVPSSPASSPRLGGRDRPANRLWLRGRGRSSARSRTPPPGLVPPGA